MHSAKVIQMTMTCNRHSLWSNNHAAHSGRALKKRGAGFRHMMKPLSVSSQRPARDFSTRMRAKRLRSALAPPSALHRTHQGEGDDGEKEDVEVPGDGESCLPELPEDAVRQIFDHACQNSLLEPTVILELAAKNSLLRAITAETRRDFRAHLEQMRARVFGQRDGAGTMWHSFLRRSEGEREESTESTESTVRGVVAHALLLAEMRMYTPAPSPFSPDP